MMMTKRKRITMDLKSPIEEAFFARLEQKEWPSLMRLILRDAIRTGRAQELKHENCFHFDEIPLVHEEDLVSEDGHVGGESYSPAFGSDGKTPLGSVETDRRQASPDQGQPASPSADAAAPGVEDSQIPRTGARPTTGAHLGKAASPPEMSSAEAMELMNLKIKEARGASGDANLAQGADRLTVLRTPITRMESAAGASSTSHEHLSGDASSPPPGASSAPHAHSSVTTAQVSDAAHPEVQPASQASTATHQSPAVAPSASFLKGFFGEASRDRLL